MSDEEIETYLKENPVEFDPVHISSSYHIACAMIGRLIRGEKYIPFYVEEVNILSPISQVNYLDEVDMPEDEFAICMSGILALMGIRDNEDLDIITPNEVTKRTKPHNEHSLSAWGCGSTNGHIESVHPYDYGIDDIESNSFKVDGYNFLYPKYYFRYKKVPPMGDQNDWERDISDWKGIVKFFEMESHKGYPFHQLTDEQLGVEYHKRYKK